MIRGPALAGLLVAVLIPGPAAAQERPMFDWSPPARHRAEVASNVLLIGQIGIDTWQSWTAERRGHAFACQGVRLGVTVGALEAVKRIVGRERPDRSDRHSFPSEHTALAFASGGWRASYTVTLGAGVAVGRMGASKHYLTDTIAGALAGTATQFLCRGD